MRDPITTAFSVFDIEPDPRFVADLRRRALTELSRGAGVSTPMQQDPLEIDVVRRTAGRVHESDRRRHRWLTVSAAAAIVALLATTAILARRDPDRRVAGPNETGQPTVGFSTHLSGDLTIADGSSVHFDADVELSQAVKSDEIGVTGESDILLLPRVSLKVSAAGAPVQLTSAYVEIFLSSDVTECIVNTSGCDVGIIRGSGPAQPPNAVTTARPYEYEDSSSASTIRVPVDSVATILRQVAAGTAVVGVAVVVSGGAPDQAVSAIFDEAGQLVLECADVPSNCMDVDQSILGGPSGASTETPTVPTFPPGRIPPGTYAPVGAEIAYSITTIGEWQLLGSSSSGIFLGRGDSSSTELVVTQDPIGGAVTPSDAIARFCPEGAVAFGPTKTTTLLGAPALEVEGPVVTECAPVILAPALVGSAVRRLQATVGSTVRIVAADVDGTVVMVVAVGPTTTWSTLEKELDATILRRL